MIDEFSFCFQREQDKQALEILKSIHDRNTELRCNSERSFLREMQGGCQIPIGVHSTYEGDQVTLKGIVLNVDGSKCIRGEWKGNAANAKDIGIKLAEKLKSEGADTLLKEVLAASNK